MKNYDLSGLKLLAIDDNEAIRWSLTAVLSNSGAEITAVSGNEYDIVFQQAFDVILLDFQMPGVDGWDIIKAIRSSSIPTIKNLPVIAVTAKASNEDKQKILDAGCNYYFSKPIAFPELLATLESIRTATHK